MRNARGITHTARIRAQFHADELAILFFTGMTVEALTDFKLDTGKEWLIKYCMRVEHFSQAEAQEMWKEPLLLQWWNLEWLRMDHYIILPIIHKIVEQEREAVYREMHCEVFLSQHPNYKLLEISLTRVLAKMSKSVSEECANV